VEEQLQEVEQLLSSTLGGIGAGFITTDASGRVTRLNQVAARITGWTQDEAVGESLWDVFQREGRPPNMRVANPVEVLVTAGVSPDEVQSVVAVSRDGTQTELELRAAVTRGDDDRPRGMIVVFRDVTRLNRAEAASRRLVAIVTSSNDAIIGKTLAGIITDWNAAAERMFGYTADEAIGQPITMLIPPDRWEEEPEILRRISAGERVSTMETVRHTKDGRRINVSITISPILDARGRVVGASKIARDITEATRRKEELERSNAELEQFAYVASHDLQEPLRMVVNYTELLANRYKGTLDEKADQYIHYAADGARRMQRLVRDLLAYSRVSSSTRPLVPVSTQRVVEGVLETLDATIRESGATVLYAQLPVVLGDEGQLTQLFQNLISNAIKYRRDESPRISITAIRTYEEWEFAVADNGIGIESPYRERVFQMFQRLHARHEYDGSGIGLAIVKRIVERHGGQIWVDSTPGEGSVFRFTLKSSPVTTPK